MCVTPARIAAVTSSAVRDLTAATLRDGSAYTTGRPVIAYGAGGAWRSATNQAEILTQLLPLCEVEVLEKNQEAQYSCLASMEAFRSTLLPGQPVLVIDQGGGSLELACGLIDAGGEIIIKGCESLPLGTVELSGFFVEAETIRTGYENVQKYINRELERHKPFAAFGNLPPEYVFGLGSTITELAQLLNKTDQSRKSLRGLHGSFIATETIRSLIKGTDAQLDVPKSVLGDRIGIDGDMSTFFGGVLSYYTLLEKYHTDGITVNRQGLRYGVLLGRCGYPYQVDLPK